MLGSFFFANLRSRRRNTIFLVTHRCGCFVGNLSTSQLIAKNDAPSQITATVASEQPKEHQRNIGVRKKQTIQRKNSAPFELRNMTPEASSAQDQPKRSVVSTDKLVAKIQPFGNPSADALWTSKAQLKTNIRETKKTLTS